MTLEPTAIIGIIVIVFGGVTVILTLWKRSFDTKIEAMKEVFDMQLKQLCDETKNNSERIRGLESAVITLAEIKRTLDLMNKNIEGLGARKLKRDS